MGKHNRNRGEGPSKMTITVGDFKEKMRRRARDGGYYVIMEILRKVKFKHQGKVCFDTPAFTLLINVVESNLPLPANVHNPVFKFKRGSNIVTAFNADGTITAKDGKDDYVGTPTPEEYFTLPDYNNIINADVPSKQEDGTHKIGEHYIHSTFVKIFEKVEDADAFVEGMLGEVERFLNDLDAFKQLNEKYFEWEKFTMDSVNPEGHNQITLTKGGPSFTEGRIDVVKMSNQKDK